MKERTTEALAFLGGAALVVSVLVGFFVINLDVQAVNHKAEEAMQFAVKHETEAAGWNVRIQKLEDQVTAVLSNPRSRADPFSGKMGRELEERLAGRIERLEKLLNVAPDESDSANTGEEHE